MPGTTKPMTLVGNYVIDRKTSALPCPRFEDVKGIIGDLLPEFTDNALRKSYRPQTMVVILGLLRAQEIFPKSTRFNAQKLVSWSNRTRATMVANDAFEVIQNSNFAPLMPYSVVSVQAFGPPLKSVIVEIHRRLILDPYGFSLLWIGSGGQVTPMHHDGDMVHGRWHL